MTGNGSEVREIHVAVGVIVRDGYVLIARRPDHAHQGGLLEFPGGKVEHGETVQSALVREIAEETGLQLSSKALHPLICIRHDYGDKRVVLDVWRTDQARGEAHGREGQAIRWVRPESLQDEDFPAANRPIIRALRLPSLLAITGAFQPDSTKPEQLRAALTQFAGTSGNGLVVLRAPGLPRDVYATFAKNGLEAAGSTGHHLLVHGGPGVFTDNPGAAGLHMPWREASKLDTRPVPHGVWLGVSCHNAGEIDHAVAIGADYVTLGPVKPTATHPGAPALGWDGFRDLVAHASVPVFGLGGLYPEDLRRAQLAGAQGVAGIRFWWPQTES